MTIEQVEKMKAQLGSQIELISVTPNLIDTVWTGKPARPSCPVHVLGLQYAGQSHIDKIKFVKRAFAPNSL